MRGSATRTTKRYYLQTLLEECKYEIEKNKMSNLINDNLNPSSCSNESDTDEFHD